jgi:hypothetical protein
MAMGFAQAGKASKGMKTPLINTIGNLKKFIKVIASKTSLTITEAVRPRREKTPTPKSKPTPKTRGLTKFIPRATFGNVVTYVAFLFRPVASTILSITLVMLEVATPR